MTRPRLLDLFCGAGGAAMGYHRAGFDVIGVDIKPQKNYPFEFIQDDALLFLKEWNFPGWIRSVEVDAIHASPPCQIHSGITAVWRDKFPDRHQDLIAPIRPLLEASGLPYVIENVYGAPLLNATMLCGSALGLPLKRHRYFETSFPMMSPGCAHGMWPKRYKIRQHGKEFDTAFCYVFGRGQAGQPVAAWREAMGIDWMTVDELSQAIPPVYTEFIGEQLMVHINAKAAS